MFFPKNHPPIPTDSVAAQTSALSHCGISSKIPQNCASSSSSDFRQARFAARFAVTRPCHRDTSGSVGFPWFSCPVSLPSRALVPREVFAFCRFHAWLVMPRLWWIRECAGGSFTAGDFGCLHLNIPVLGVADAFLVRNEWFIPGTSFTPDAPSSP